jgi:RNA polymerase sigma-70 factor (ECF subfamily)
MSVAMRYSSDRDSAQDIVSDSFIKVFDKIDTFKGKGSIEGWVLRIVANTGIDFLKKNKNTFIVDVDAMVHYDGLLCFDEEFEFDGIEDILDLPKSEILKEIQKLAPVHRAVFNMHVFEGMTHKEIAEELGIVEGTSKSTLSKAKVIIKKRMEILIEQKRNRESNIEKICRASSLEHA